MAATLKICFSVKPELLARVDARARDLRVSRSAFIIGRLDEEKAVATLFPLFEEGKEFADVVLATGLPPATVRRVHEEFVHGFKPIPAPAPEVEAARLKLEAAKLERETARENNTAKVQMQERQIFARRELTRERLAAQEARGEQEARAKRMEALMQPRTPRQ
jgi:hypothetical protein